MSNFERVLKVLKEGKTDLDNMLPNECAEKIEAIFKKYFPDGYFKKQISTLGGVASLGMTFASTTEEGWKNKIIQNDPLWVNFWIHGAWDKEMKAQTKPFVVEKPSGGVRGIKWIKATGWKSIEKQFEKYFALAKENLKK